jgi:hypothetical protein
MSSFSQRITRRDYFEKLDFEPPLDGVFDNFPSCGKLLELWSDGVME